MQANDRMDGAHLIYIHKRVRKFSCFKTSALIRRVNKKLVRERLKQHRYLLNP